MGNATGSVLSSNAMLTVIPVSPNCVPPPAGLVGWWRGEGNAQDAASGNNGVFSGAAAFAPGEVGQAFRFDGVTSAVTVPASSGLAVQSFTIEAWIEPFDTSLPRPIVEYGASNGEDSPLDLWYNWTATGAVPGALYGIIRSPGNVPYLQINSAGGLVPSYQWSHVAFSYDAASRLALLYVNGSVVASNSSPVALQPQTDVPVNLGYRPEGSGDLWGGRRYSGLLDEVSIYRRALAAAEIQSLYAAGRAGKCLRAIPPSILVQPASQTVAVGQSATFSVTAAGLPPLSYQWRFNNAPLAGATNAILTLLGVQTANAGNYAVWVSNVGGLVLSSNAALTVIPGTSNCVPPPAGLVSWWRAEGNAQDARGANSGTLMNGTSFGPGMAGTAFDFSGVNQFVSVANAPSLNPTNALTLETWVYPTGPPASDGMVIWAKDDASLHREYLLVLASVGGQWVFRPHVGAPTGFFFFNGRTPVQLNTWYHVAVTYDGSTLRLYVNGNLDGSLPVTGPIITTAQPFLIGGIPGGPWYFTGRIDELSLYNRALSAGEILTIYNAGGAGKCPAVTPPSIITQPASQTVAAGASATLSVTAVGSPPLSYLWRFNNAPLLPATNAMLVLTNVQIANAGSYSVMVSNPFGFVTSSNALLTVKSASPAVVQVISTKAAPGSVVGVPIALVANGNENALGFSLIFAPGDMPPRPGLRFVRVDLGAGAPGGTLVVNSNSLASGQLGVLVAMPLGTTFRAGSQQVVVVQFQVSGSGVETNSGAAFITFGNQPVVRQLSDPQANALPATYLGGWVSITPMGYEGDVSPRPNGDRLLAVSDWVQEGRFVAGLDQPAIGSEFQRADCAPRATLGDGRITVSDWVQVGRYAAGLDPLTPAGGPLAAVPTAAALFEGATPQADDSPAPGQTVVRVVDATIDPGQAGTVRVAFEAQGTENALGFGLAFDPASFSFAGAAPGSDVAGTTLDVNTSQIASGRVGFALALPAGSRFAAGTSEVVQVSLRPLATASGSFAVTFTDQPVPREVADAAANTLAANYVNGAIVIRPPTPALKIARSGDNFILSWPLWATNFVLQVSDGTTPSATWTNAPATATATNNESVVTLPLSGETKFYRLYQP